MMPNVESHQNVLSILFDYRKSMELLRLIELKGFSALSQTAKVVFSLERASLLCGTEFDHQDDAIRFTNMGKKEYVRNKKMFEKLLGLQRQLQLKDICLQMDLPSSIQSNAQRLLNAYASSAKFADDIQSAHCLTMAVYQCCKRQKLKSTKQKLMALSDLDAAKWKQFEEKWDKWIVTEEPLKENTTSTKTTTKEPTEVNNVEQQHDAIAKTVEQPYEEWKKQMIDKAMAEIQQQNSNWHRTIHTYQTLQHFTHCINL